MHHIIYGNYITNRRSVIYCSLATSHSVQKPWLLKRKRAESEQNLSEVPCQPKRPDTWPDRLAQSQDIFLCYISRHKFRFLARGNQGEVLFYCLHADHTSGASTSGERDWNQVLEPGVPIHLRPVSIGTEPRIIAVL